MTDLTLPPLGGGRSFIEHLPQFFLDLVSVLRQGYRDKEKLFSFKLTGRRMNVMLGPGVQPRI